MSYIYSQALVAASLPASCLGTEQSAPLNGSPTPKPCLWHDKTMEPSRLSRFGMTCKPLTDDHGAALLTSWQAGFRAKTSAPQAKALALTASEAECGATWPASLAKLDPDTSSWKTHQHSLLGGLDEFSQTWPRWGLMRNGECWERATLAPRISESASGLWPTPDAHMGTGGRVSATYPTRTRPSGSKQQITLKDAVKWNTPAKKLLWPTPTQDSATDRAKRYAQGGLPLTAAVAASLAPAADMSLTTSCLESTGAPTAKVRTYPTATATATAYKGWSPNHNRADTDDRLDYTIEREGFTPGQTTPPMRLNPDWVEWLMGWPIGHTDLKPLETAKYQEWLQQHGGF